MSFDISSLDFRLLTVAGELFALEDHLLLIEGEIEKIEQQKKIDADDYLKKHALSPYTPEWFDVLHERDYYLHLVLPRLFRGPFLVALYAVYESAVLEIADLIPKKEGQEARLGSKRGNFLKRAEEYYDKWSDFPLFVDTEERQRIQMLSTLRNAFAHSNGRIDMVRPKIKDLIKQWGQSRCGISIYGEFIICDSAILAELLHVVRNALERLISKCKSLPDYTI